MSEIETLKVVSANIEEGGLDADGSRTRWERTVAVLIGRSPDVVCVQEMAARRDPGRLRAHLWETANALGMIPVLGSEGGVSGNHTAILVSPRLLRILDEGPPPRQPGHDPAWCEARLQVGLEGPVLRVYSVHLPPSSSVEQLRHAQRLANRAAQRGEHAILAGDWNCWAPADRMDAGTLAGMAPHLRPARMRMAGGVLAANYDVDETLAAVGLVDAAAGLDPSCRRPRDLAPTGINGGGRVDRFYVTAEMWEAGAVQAYEQFAGGSDHEFIAITIGSRDLASAAAPGFRH